MNKSKKYFYLPLIIAIPLLVMFLNSAELKVEKITTIEKKLTVKERKKLFIEIMLPAIKLAKNRVEAEYEKVSLLISKSPTKALESRYIKELLKRYKAKTLKELLLALKTHPTSIVLAQAALESGWGSSRFFKEANNIFGIWSYDKNEPRIAARESRGKHRVYLKKYSNIEDSVEDYFLLIARGKSFKSFRELRAKNSNPNEIIHALENYSELREEYTRRVGLTIRSNNFTKYD